VQLLTGFFEESLATLLPEDATPAQEHMLHEPTATRLPKLSGVDELHLHGIHPTAMYRDPRERRVDVAKITLRQLDL
jgi:hypothetical protein